MAAIIASTSSISKAEKSYIQTALQSSPPLRADGRSLIDYRTVLLETGVAPLANGSARVNIGKSPHEGGGGTEVLAAVKLEVEDVENGEGIDGGRVVCSVSCWSTEGPSHSEFIRLLSKSFEDSSPSAYPHLNSNTLDELQYDLTTLLHQTLAHPSLHPKNLGILPRKKAWLLNLDAAVLSDVGNTIDALFMAARAALWDTKVPRTRAVQYRARRSGAVVGSSGAEMDVDEDLDQEERSGFDTRDMARTAADFELPDYWDEGEMLDGREKWPVAVTLNIVPSLHFLDATLPEEASTPVRVVLAFSFPPGSPPSLQTMRLLGSGELTVLQIKTLLADGEKYARGLFTALEAKLHDEDVRRNVRAHAKFAVR